MSDAPPQIKVLKGKTGKMVIDTWESLHGRTLVSVAQMFMDSDSGEYVRKKGGFALSAAEARELTAALVEVAGCVEGAGIE